MTTARTEIVARHLQAFELARRLKNAGAMVSAVDALVEQFGLAKVEPEADTPLTIVIRRFICEHDEKGNITGRKQVSRGPVKDYTDAPARSDITDAEAERVMALLEQHGRVDADEADMAEFLRALLSTESEAEHADA